MLVSRNVSRNDEQLYIYRNIILSRRRKSCFFMQNRLFGFPLILINSMTVCLLDPCVNRGQMEARSEKIGKLAVLGLADAWLDRETILIVIIG